MRITLLTVLASSALLLGCNETESDLNAISVASQAEAAYEGPGKPVQALQTSALAPDADLTISHKGTVTGYAQAPIQDEPKRIAQSQSWTFEIEAEKLQEVWQAHHDLCSSTLRTHCELVQASVMTGQGRRGAHHALLEMRVTHSAMPSLVQNVENGILPVEKNATSVDRTLQWVDLNARKENAERLRDRLAVMIAEQKGDKLSDLLALERELNRVQSNLDAMQAQTRILARETEKVHLTFHYRSAPQTVADDVWRPIRSAWHNMAQTFASSVGSVLLFVAGIVPWLVVLIPGWFLVRASIRRFKRHFFSRKKPA